jgi:hypothetical protein
MARVIQSLCDVCLAEDRSVAGSQVTVSVNAAEPVMVDLCQEHMDALITPVVNLLQASGVTADGRPASKSRRVSIPTDDGDRPHPCPYCTKRYPRPSGVNNHVKLSHPEQYPGHMEAQGASAVKCKVKGCGRSFYGQQALGMHMHRAHPGK